MFHWICPECGREIAPTVRECPVCEPAADLAEMVHAGVVEASARTANTAASVANPEPALTAPPAPEFEVVQTSSQHPTAVANNGGARTLLLRKTGTKPGIEPSGKASQGNARKQLAAPSQEAGTRPSDAQRVVPVASVPTGAATNGPENVGAAVTMPIVANAPKSLPPPELPEPILPTLDRDQALSTLDSMVEAMGLISESEPSPNWPPNEPSPQQDVVETSAVETSAEDISAVEANDRATSDGLPDPPLYGSVPIGVRSVPSAVHSLIRELRPQAETPATKPAVVESPKATPEPWTPPMQVAIPAAQPKPRRLIETYSPALKAVPMAKRRLIGPASPNRMAAPRMGRLVRYRPFDTHPIIPAPPPAPALKLDTSYRFTLPGPMLTSRLVKFSERELTAIFLEAKKFRKKSFPAWILAATLGASVVFAGYSGVFSSFVPRSNADTQTDPAPITRTTGSNSMARMVEVTGFRVLMDTGKKPEIQYLVVNHSGAQFGDAVVFVTLRAASAEPGQPPLCRFSFAAPDMGPYQSREMTATIEKLNRPIAVPEWQDLRAEVEIR